MEKCDLCSHEPSDSFRLPFGRWQDLFSVLKLFPIPAEVFSQDGVSLFVNPAFSDFFCISAENIVGKLNILKDPYINGTLGLTDYLQRVFAGELLSFHDLKAPFGEINIRYPSAQSRDMSNDMYLDITCLPLWDENGSVAYVVALFMTKCVYQSRLDAMRAKEYIDSHWLEDFDMEGIAQSVNMSRYHLARLFKKIIGMTPYSYYQEVKIEKLKEALGDDRLSISEAFTFCGTDYSGSFAGAFKRKVGMTPSQYRKASAHRSGEGLKKAANALEQDPLESSAAAPSHSLCAMESRLFQIAELFPIPIQIFKPNGDIIFINEAVLKMWNVQDTTLILGKYNLLRDPLVNDQFGLRDQIGRTFRGELTLIQDIRVPLESFWEWYKTRSAVYDIEAIYTDILNFPVWCEDQGLAYVVSIFFTSRIYSGRPDVAKAREYLENHWWEEFDAARLTQVSYLSPSHLERLFKKQTGITPYGYYQEIKIDRLKAALRDKNLSIAEAFISCGFEYHSNSARFFKEKVGMTPSQYRKTIEK